MNLPAFFELDGKFAAMIDSPDGGVKVIKDPGPSIADFMSTGSVIKYEDLPESMKRSVDNANNPNTSHI